MPNWGQVLNEIAHLSMSREMEARTAVDVVRKKYLKDLHDHTGRNIIAYYSGWLQKPDIEGNQISDDDKNGFMMAIHGMDCSKGLDLILHTPGGGIAAAESIIDYLHRKFINNSNDVDIRIIVPQIAMSAGTMIACSGKTILMGKQSNLGPIDPQLRGIPAHGVVGEFRRAHEEIKADGSKLAVWQFILQKYHPTFLTECENAIALSEEFVLKNLKNVMFKGDKKATSKAKKIVSYLTAYKERKTHGRHINIDECKSIGLKIEDLESEQKLQDLVLTIHHCYMHTLANTQTFKIIENHQGATMARIQALVQVQTAA
jgi:hypothetical protein